MTDEKQILRTHGDSVRIEVIGRPRTKGSMRPVHVKVKPGVCRVALTESGEYSKPWKDEMIRAIRAQCAIGRTGWPVIVDATFRFERLSSTDADLDWPTREKGAYAHGDVDKLVRNALDALTQSGLIQDDALVVGGSSIKRFCTDGELPGVTLLVSVA